MKSEIINIGIICGLLGVFVLCRGIEEQEGPVIKEQAPAAVCQPDTLSEWQVLQMAIIFTESRFNPAAVGKAKDSGIMQITPIYVKEVNRLAGTSYTMEDCFDIDKSLEMFGIMQALKNPAQDIDSAIYYHNKSPYYKKTVKKNMELIRRMETVRKQIKNQ